MKALFYTSIIFFLVFVTLLILGNPCIYDYRGTLLYYTAFRVSPIKIYNMIINEHYVLYLLISALVMCVITIIHHLVVLKRMDNINKWPYYLTSIFMSVFIVMTIIFVSQQYKYIGNISKEPLLPPGIYIKSIEPEQNIAYILYERKTIKLRTNTGGMQVLQDVINNPPRDKEIYLVFYRNDLLGKDFYWLAAIYANKELKYQFIYYYFHGYS